VTLMTSRDPNGQGRDPQMFSTIGLSWKLCEIGLQGCCQWAAYRNRPLRVLWPRDQ